MLDAFEEILEYLDTFPEARALYNTLKVLDTLTEAKISTDTESSSSRLCQERILKSNGIQVLSDLAEKCSKSQELMDRVGPTGVQIMEKLTSCNMIVTSILETSIPQVVVMVMAANVDTLTSALSVLSKIQPDGYEVFLKLGIPKVLIRIVIETENERRRVIAAEGLFRYGKAKEVAQVYYELGFLKDCLLLLQRPNPSNSFLLLVLKLVELMAELLNKESIQDVIELGFMPVLLDHFNNQSVKVTAQVVSLLKLLCSGSDIAKLIVKESIQTLSRLIFIAKNFLNQDTKNKSVEILWTLANGSEEEQRGLAGLLGPMCIVRMVSVTKGSLQLIAITLLKLISPAVYQLQEEIFDTSGIISVLTLIRLGSRNVQLQSLQALESLSFDTAMRVNKVTQTSVQEGDGLQLLLRLYSLAGDKKLKAQICCTLAAVSMGNLSMTEVIFNDPRFSIRELIEELSASSPDKEVLSTIMRAVTYFAYASIETQIILAKVKKIPIKPFRRFMWGRDKFTSNLAAFQLIVLMRVLDTEEDKSFLVAECMRFLFDELESAMEEGRILLQAQICALLSSTLHIRVGLPGALLASGVVTLLIRLLSSDVEPCRRTAAITLSYLTLSPKGSRMILGYCRKKPWLFTLLKKYSSGYSLSKSFLEGWDHYRSTHLKPKSSLVNEEAELIPAFLIEAKVFGEHIDSNLYKYALWYSCFQHNCFNLVYVFLLHLYRSLLYGL